MGQKAQVPIYAFRCPAGHEFEILGKLDRSDEPKSCSAIDHELSDRLHVETTCGQPVERLMSVNAKSFPGADSWRR